MIEDHYTIKNLIQRQQKRADDREFHRARIKSQDELANEIEKAKDIEKKDFYCETCNLDFVANAKKQIDSWSQIAYYKSKCRSCGSWSMRLITDRHRDRYFHKSKLVALDRGKGHDDMLQPWQTGFNTLYGKQSNK